MKVNISIVIPCYNEERNIDTVYHNIKGNMPNEVSNYELIFVNDGSTDGTEEKIKQLRQLDSHVKLVSLEKNSGYGGSIRVGLHAVQYSYVFYIDGDGQYDFSDAKRILKLMLLDNLDVVVPFREKREDEFYREIVSWIGNFFCKVMFGVNHKDINCGFKLLKKESLKKIKLRCNSAVLFSLEIYLKVKMLHLKVKQIPIKHLRRKEGSAKGINRKQYLLALNDVRNLLKYHIVSPRKR